MSNQKSTTVYSVPTTPEEQRYYSKHSPKRKVYGIAQFFFQIAHIALAFSAWSAIFTYALENFGSSPIISGLLAAVTLFVLHLIFRTTWESYWYDKLDNDPNTDSSPILPVVIILLLLITEQQGAAIIFKGAVKKEQHKDAAPVVEGTNAEINSLRQLFAETEKQINAKYAPIIAAKTAKIDARIGEAQRRTAISDNDIAYKRRTIASLKASRAEAVSAIEMQKAAEIATAAEKKDNAIANIQSRKEAGLATITEYNNRETTRYQSEVSQAGGLAWLVSTVLILIICILGYAKVRINVKSGILPIRTFTELDQHGGVFELIGVAVGDAFKRRATQYTTLLHRKLSPSESITTIDGTVITTPGTYNNFDVQNLSPVANVPPADRLATAVDMEQRLRTAEMILLRAVAKIKAAEGDYKIDEWIVLNDYRQKLCNAGIISIVKDDLVLCLEGEMSFGEMCQKYPYPPSKKEPTPTPPATSKQPEYDAVYNAKPLSDLPEGFEHQADGTILFKQDYTLFKQQKDEQGRVVGLLYKGTKSDWTTLGYAQVLSYFNTYKKRAQNEASDASQHGLAKWSWAISLFEDSNKNSETIKPIHL
jgi:hypothetical protein